MVFSVGLLLALVTYYSLPELLSMKEVTLVKNPGQADMEIIRKKGKKLERYRMTLRKLQGEGVRLGTAYRLANGEVVYVPDSAAEASETPEAPDDTPR